MLCTAPRRAAPRGQITDCYRMEQLPDGRELHVELPHYECQ
jgi:hypothetical protein